MTKYILIQNDGEIETNSFELIGASTKRNQQGKIGFFGSGLKYSIAYMMRNNIGFRIFSGETELKFTTIGESLKDQIFERICINGKPTSYTITMGPTWTKDWFILREIYCNALDEGGCIMVKDAGEPSPSSGKTRIYIESTESLAKVVAEWDRYFSEDRTPMFVSEKVYTSAVGSEDNSPSGNRQPVKVYQKSSGVLYRRGVNVYESKKYLYDYELQFVSVNEDRTAKAIHCIDYMFSDMIGLLVNEEWVKSVLRTATRTDETKCPEYYSISWHDPDSQPSEKWIQFGKENMLVVEEISARYSQEMSLSKKEVFYIPAKFARFLKKKLPSVPITGMTSMIGDMSFEEVDKTPKMDYLLKEVLRSLSEMKYNVPFDIHVANFDEDGIMGRADIEGKKIYIAASTFDMGRREIAMTLIEETEHIISKEGDYTRKFQTHIFSKWLTSMENATGLFL